MQKELSVLVGGQAGEGIRRAGVLIAKLLNRCGYNIFIYDEYPSLIRGGHNFSVVRASEEKIFAHRSNLDLILALNKDAIERHGVKLTPKGFILFDKDKTKAEGVGISLTEIVNSLGGKEIMRNVALIGAFAKAVGIKWEVVEEVLKREMPKQKELNIRISKEAYTQASTLIEIKLIQKEPVALLTGNEAIALGAVKAGLGMYLGYPMTPASSLLHYLAASSKDLGIITIHPENVLNTMAGHLRWKN